VRSEGGLEGSEREMSEGCVEVRIKLVHNSTEFLR